MKLNLRRQHPQESGRTGEIYLQRRPQRGPKRTGWAGSFGGNLKEPQPVSIPQEPASGRAAGGGAERPQGGPPPAGGAGARTSRRTPGGEGRGAAAEPRVAAFSGARRHGAPRRPVSHTSARGHPVPAATFIKQGLALRSSPERTKTLQQRPAPAPPAPSQTRGGSGFPALTAVFCRPLLGFSRWFTEGGPVSRWGARKVVTSRRRAAAPPVTGSAWISASGGGSKALGGS